MLHKHILLFFFAGLTITSIAQPLFDLGAQAVDLLMRALNEPAREPLELVVPCRLDVRESTARPWGG